MLKVDPEDILDPGVETEECPMLLNLHDGIALQEDELETVGDGKTEYLKKHLETLRQIVRRYCVLDLGTKALLYLFS